jgi:hypothetical protein
VRINIVVGPMKYNEHRGFNDSEHRGGTNTSVHNGKQDNENLKMTFSEILKQVKTVNNNLYSR